MRSIGGEVGRLRRGRAAAPAAAVAAVLLCAGAVSASSRVETASTAAVACTCSKTGPYVSPAAGTVVSGQQTQSPHGTYTATWTANGTVTVHKGTATVMTTSGTAGGFSPDDHAFVAESLAGDVETVRLFNLTAPTPGSQIFAATPTVTSSRLAFSPSGHYLFLGYTTASQTFLRVADTTVPTQADQHEFTSGGLTTTGAPGAAGDSFGSVAYGFGPDDSRFVYAYLASSSQVSWRWVDLEDAAHAIHTDATSGSSAYVQFSPCGDVLAIVNGFGSGTVTIDLFDSSSGAAVGQQWRDAASSKPALETTAAEQKVTVDGVADTLAPNTCTPPAGGGGGGGGGGSVPATGDFVDPKPGTLVSGRQTASSKGTYTASWSGGDVTVRKAGSAVLTTQGTAGGFSPDEHAFVAETLNGGTTSIRLFNLNGPSPGTAIWNGGATVTSEQLVFSPSGRYLLHAYTTSGNQTHFEIVDATATGTTTPLYTTSVSTATGAPTGATGAPFGTVSYGFGPDDSRFVFGYATGSAGDLVDWVWADLSRPPVQARSVQNLVAASSYVQFTPCGNALAVVSVGSNGFATVGLRDSSADGSLGTASDATSGQPIALKAETDSFTATIGGTKHTLAPNTCPGGGGDGGGGGTGGVPHASFTPPSGTVAGVAATFADTSTDDGGTISAWSWDFGDGSGGSNVQSPTHTFAAAGTYTVKLTVTDSGGATATATHDVVVAAGAPQAVSFGSAWGFRAGAQPWSVAIGDLDGDGKADVAAANLHSNSISVFRGDGAGGLAPKTDYGTGKNPGAVAIGDLNGDGSADLVASSGGGGSVTVLLADGHGGFAAKQTYATGEVPFDDEQLYGVLNQSLALADLNGDGTLDVAVANGGSNTVSILLGDGSGALGTHTDVPAGARPESVAAGDLNGDGKPDLVVAATGSDSVGVLIGDGAGGFAPVRSFPAGPEPSSVAVGDFDRDGNADVAVAAYTGAVVSVLAGDGSGGLGPKTDYAVGTHPESVAVADLDGDGDDDLAVANGASDSVSVLPGDGDGGFGTRIDLGTGKGPLWVAAGDLDGDGVPDLATADSTSDTVSVLLDLGAPGGLRARFTASPSRTPGSLQVDADASDSTGDGLSYAWSFGDGSEGAGVHVQHAYASAGVYTVTLTVTADGGGTAEVSHSVTVPAAPPPAAGPGALTQLPSPDDCIAADDSEGCGTTTAFGLESADWVAVSPDGKNVYTISFFGDSVAAFSRGADGSLTQLPRAAACVAAFENHGCGSVFAGLAEATSVAVSPDGQDVYVTGDQDETVIALRRAADGSLSPLQCVQNVDARFDRCATKITGLDNPYDVTVSPDGKNVYVAAGGGGGTQGAIVEFARAADGTLTQLAAPNDCIEEQGNSAPVCGIADGEGLLAVTALAVSPDGADLYAVSDTHYVSGDDAPGAVTAFRRDPDTGALTQLGCTGQPAATPECQTVTAAGLSDLVNVAISPDGKNVYTASDDANGAIAEFRREDDGSLTALGCAGGGSPCTVLAPGLASVFGLAVSPDGQNVYAAAAGSFTPQVAPGVVALSRAADGTLTPVGGPGGCIEQAGAGGAVCANTSGHGLADALGVAVSPDGANVYTAASGGAVAAFARDAAQAGSGGSLTVTTTADGSDGACTRALCTLRDAVEASNAAGGGTVTVPAGHYVLTLGPLFVTSPIAIGGAGADVTVLDGNDAEQVVRGDRSAAPAIALSDLTVTGGHSQAADAPDYNEGGGISSWGPLTLARVAVVGNTAYADGGGVEAIRGLTIVDSTIAGNTANGTAGGVRAQLGALSIVNSTIAGNSAQNWAALELFGLSSATIVSSTIAGNTNSAGFQAAIEVQSASVTLKAVAIANDPANNTSNCAGTFVSAGHNLATDSSCGLTGPGDQPGVADAGLGVLEDNGGPTETMLPQPGSPLIDAGGPDCPATDQRGDARPVGAACDVGAVEAPPSANLPPVAAFAATPAAVPGSLDVSLDASAASDPDGEVTGYAWSFGDGSTGSGAATSHTYAVGGTYAVALTVTDDRGATATISHDVTVPATAANLPPAARFTTATSVGSLDVGVDGTGSSDAEGPIASYAWDFGDGGAATGATAAHTYLAAGTFTIRLTVTDGGGATASVTHDVTVPAAPNRAPTASFGFPSNADPATLTIALSGRGSSDPDGTIASYAWDWGDGEAGAGLSATHTYAAAGDYTVTLTVTDDDGATGSFSRRLHVPVRLADSRHSSASAAPASVPADGLTAATVTVTMRDEHGDPISGLDVRLFRSSGHATIAPAGSVQTDEDGVATFAVTSDTAGTAVLEADDLSEALVVDVVDVEFTEVGSNEAPTASFTATPSAEGLLTVALDGSGSSDPDGSVADWAWDFGDGATGSGATTSHGYAAAGTYTISLTVTDDAGATATATRTVTLSPPRDEPPTPSFTATPSTSPGSLQVDVDASASSDADGSIASYAWDFGDGTSASGKTVAHAYAAAGTYTIRLTVTDDGGATASATHEVTVPAVQPKPPVTPPPPRPLPPSVDFSFSPASGDATTTWRFDASASSRVGSYRWDFGDGGHDTGATATHVYARPGTYTVRLTGSGAGGSATATHTVTVGARPPRAAFYYQPVRPVPGRTIGFIADSTVVDGGAPIVSYAWDFGDGTTATGQRAAHVYLDSGSFVVTLTVTDATGQTATASATVGVVAAGKPSVMFVYQPTPVAAGAETTFAGIAIRRRGSWASTRLVGWTWSFGDGTTAGGQLVHHTFADAGSYRVRLTVRDAGGATGTVASTVVVEPKGSVVAVDETVTVDDAATLVPPLSVDVGETVVVSDAPGLVPPTTLTVTEGVGVSDVPGLVPPAVITVLEPFGTTDTTTAVHH